MVTRYKVVEWAFDYAAWHEAIRAAVPADEIATWAELFEMHPHTLKKWYAGAAPNAGFPYPNMTNFLKICNALDFDPREFFMIVDL